MKQPTVGDIVHFHPSENSAPRAAIIVRVNPIDPQVPQEGAIPTVNLTVFSDRPNEQPDLCILAAYSETPKAGHWTPRPAA